MLNPRKPTVVQGCGQRLPLVPRLSVSRPGCRNTTNDCFRIELARNRGRWWVAVRFEMVVLAGHLAEPFIALGRGPLWL